MAEFETIRPINLPQSQEVYDNDVFVIDSETGGVRKIPKDKVMTKIDDTLTKSGEAADAKKVGDEFTAQGELIQNPTKTVSGSIAHFTDGADMPAKSVIVNIEPVQSGTGTPSPDNVRQISGWESVNLFDTGKNLLKNDLLVSGSGNGVTWTVNADGSVTLNGTATAGMRINITSTLHFKEGEYTLSGGVTGCSIAVQGIGATNSSRPLIVSEYYNGQSWLYVDDGASFNNVTLYPMIRRADEDATYQPYVGTEDAISLGQTVYGARPDIVSGEMIVTYGYVDLGTLNWSYVSGSGSRFIVPKSDIKPPSTGGSIANLICSIYMADSTDNIYNHRNDGAIGYHTGLQQLWVYDSRYTSASDFKTAMSGVQLVYELATPQTYQLTPTEVKTVLGENNVWADAGNVEVTYRRDINLALSELEQAIISLGSNV